MKPNKINKIMPVQSSPVPARELSLVSWLGFRRVFFEGTGRSIRETANLSTYEGKAKQANRRRGNSGSGSASASASARVGSGARSGKW
jgi:hypothetical protein